jgi:hypothetical protein
MIWKIFVTSIKTAEKKQTEIAVGCSVLGVWFFIDPPEADKCLLACGELDVGCSMFIFQNNTIWHKCEDKAQRHRWTFYKAVKIREG